MTRLCNHCRQAASDGGADDIAAVPTADGYAQGFSTAVAGDANITAINGTLGDNARLTASEASPTGAVDWNVTITNPSYPVKDVADNLVGGIIATCQQAGATQVWSNCAMDAIAALYEELKAAVAGKDGEEEAAAVVAFANDRATSSPPATSGRRTPRASSPTTTSSSWPADGYRRARTRTAPRPAEASVPPAPPITP